MRYRQTVWLLFAILIVFPILPILASAAGPDEEILAAIRSLKDFYNDESLVAEERTAAVQKIIFSRLDILELTRQILGPENYPRHRNRHQEFADAFKGFINVVLLPKAEAIKDWTIDKFVLEKNDGEFAEVRTVLVKVDAGGVKSDAEIKFNLIRRDGVWRVYDIGLEGISMVGLHRSQVARILRRNHDDFNRVIEEYGKKQGGR